MSLPLFIKKVLYSLILVIATLIVYSSSFSGPFIFDDSRIYSNPHIRISELTVDNLLQAGLKSKPVTRPVANISFAVNYFFNKYRVKGYHVVNLSVHIVTGILFYFLAGFMLELPVVQKRYGAAGLVPFVAALIWLVHPIQTQSVLYIVQRMNAMAGMFYVAAFLCYVWSRHLKGRAVGSCLLLVFCLLFGLLAAGSKENAVMLPFFLLLYEFYFVRNLSVDIRSIRFFCVLFGAFCLMLALVYLYLGPHPLQNLLDYSTRSFTPVERLLTEFRVVIFYISLIFLPHPSRLNLNHQFSISLTPFSPWTTILAIMVIVNLVVVAVMLAKKDRLISFAIFWFLGNLLMESSIIPLEIVFEHRLYIPSLMAILAIVLFSRRLINESKTFWVIFAAIPILFAVWSYHRTLTWQDDVTFWQDCYGKSPQSVRSANSLALAYEKRGDYIKAEKVFSEALNIDHRAFIVLANLGGLFIKKNNLLAAESFLVRALEIEKDFPPALLSMAIIRQKQGRRDEAENFYLRLVKKEPFRPQIEKIYEILGRFREDKGDLKRAVEFYNAALVANSEFALAHNDIGIIFARIGNVAGAVEHFQRALEIDQKYLDARKNLQNALRYSQ